ncbi:MORN repeat variant [Posidoniimonas polymericola]|uniref:MORN repeat variant n=1 Tax=Posidoniimonas polymericola TaxID=2528002 RepID=A0A5C5YI79_9BACT|nr:toxin-antitoxin system YwqK family antitoxin [Posidoniimonas polymericola]TWT74572.1 MORN repeat variant [Posidoniimonas polymericola]
MTRPRFDSPVLAVLCCLSAAGVAWSQGSSDLKIKAYDGPAIYLEESADEVPAQVVGNSVQRDTYDNGKPKIERGLTKYSDNSLVSNGIYREYYRDGQQFVDGQFVDGQPTGEWTYWRPNGELAKKVTFQDGLPDGQVEVHRADGTLEARRSFKLGKRDGTWETYADNGETLITEHAYTEGVRSGTWKWWYENGNPMREASFDNGVMTGVAVEWAEDGSKRAEIPFREGKRHGVAKQWTADGREIAQTYEDGKPVRN